MLQPYSANGNHSFQWGVDCGEPAFFAIHPVHSSSLMGHGEALGQEEWVCYPQPAPPPRPKCFESQSCSLTFAGPIHHVSKYLIVINQTNKLLNKICSVLPPWQINFIVMWTIMLECTVLLLLEFGTGTRWYSHGWLLARGSLYPPTHKTLSAYLWYMRLHITITSIILSIQLLLRHSEPRIASTYRVVWGENYRVPGSWSDS